MGGTAALTAAPTTREGIPGPQPAGEGRGLELEAATCTGEPRPTSDVEVDEPQGRRLTRVVARLRPCRPGERWRSEDEAKVDGPLEVLACDAKRTGR